MRLEATDWARAWRRLGPIDAAPLIEVLDDLVWRAGGSGRPGQFAMIDAFPPRVAEAAGPIFEHCLGLVQAGRRGMTLLSRLVPGQVIDPHRDGHDGHCKVRVHVPLTTNPACVFINKGDAFHMEVGSAYVIDPTELHSAVNGGASDRIHLIFNARA